MCRTFYCCHAKTNLHEEKDRYTLQRSRCYKLYSVHLNHIERVYVCVHKCLCIYIHVHTNYGRKLRKFFGHCTFKQFQFVVRIPFSSVQILFRCRTPLFVSAWHKTNMILHGMRLGISCKCHTYIFLWFVEIDFQM